MSSFAQNATHYNALPSRKQAVLFDSKNVCYNEPIFGFRATGGTPLPRMNSPWRMLFFGLVAALCLTVCAASAQEATTPASASVPAEDVVTLSGTRAFVNFDLLKQLNGDTVGWLYLAEDRLSQPVLQTTDNEHYQKRGFDGGILSGKGSVYLDADASPAMDEPVVFLYGGGREGACLNALNQYQDQAFYEANTVLRLLTPSGDWQADVFASVKTVQRARAGFLPGQEGAGYVEWIARVLQNSEIMARVECLPNKNDRLLVITVQNSGTNRRLIFARLTPIVYDTQAERDLTKVALDGRETQNGYAQVPGAGEMMVYAQNDPLWGSMRYESEQVSVYRNFEGGGCGPTAAAMVAANLVDAQDLPRLKQHAANGLGTLMCACSVNRVYCNHTHAPYLLETPQEYLRYLPVAMADFAAGNNEWGVNSRPADSVGSNMRFFDYICQAYGLQMTPVNNLNKSLEMLSGKGGDAVVLCCALRGSPFTNSSHYVVIASVEDGYAYILDPLRRTAKEYAKSDTRHILEVVSPGVTRIALKDMGRSDLNPVAYVERAPK